MKKILFVALFCLISSSAYAAGTQSFQASLTPAVAIQSKDTKIVGLLLNLWGENPQSGLAIGLINGSSGDSQGVSVGLFNYADNYKGVEWGAVNYAQINFTGLQYGFINYAYKLKGLQLGAVNIAQTADSGLQIGFINIIQQNHWFQGFPNELAKGMVLINWRF